jgi:hypothetical protein
MRKLLGLALIVAAGAGACKTVREELPTQPEDPETVANGSLIPAAPTATPTPDPARVEPLPAPPGSGGGGGGGGDTSASCGLPAPPQITRVNVRIHIRRPARTILDATPIVGPDVDYCRQIGYTDGRSLCPVRPPGHPERAACEAATVGLSDTGRTGPTWSADGRPCGSQTSGAHCENHPDNQYFVFAYGSGTFRACVAGGACGKIELR